jgi:peptide-methionine (S)-S-oxide reductase
MDKGTNYRSAIFYHTLEKKNTAEQSKINLEKTGTYRKKIVTEIAQATEFYQAEDYHQQYLEKQGLSSCPR